ncbi:hypothetical protein SAMN06296386_11733 [Lachnospiraceae bacterium]|nr:hypothetical protein SAMN06296386_11733 [Lachnospiraceae bacterium]
MRTEENMNGDTINVSGHPGEPSVTSNNSRTEVLRHVESEEDRKMRPKRHEYKETVISRDTLSLFGIAAVVIVLLICALAHVKVETMPVPVSAITVVIVLLMAVFMGNSPTWISLTLIALLLIIGAVTGMYTIALVGAVVYLSVISVIKGKFDD